MKQRVVAIAVAALAAGCGGGSKSALLVQVDYSGTTPPTAVDVHLFDRFGIIGTQHVAAALLPGTLTVTGLPAEEVRVVAVADSSAGHLLAGVMVSTVDGQAVHANLILSATYNDRDRDDVPDSLDGCPAIADPLQTNTAGMGENDVCLPGGGPDLAGSDGGVVLPGDDLAVPAGSDLATGPGDLATGPGDLATPPPDLGRVSSACPNGTQSGLGFCDGFEGANGTGPTIATGRWEGTVTDPAGSSVVIDTSRAYRGNSSLHLHSPALTAASDLEVYQTAYLPAHFYARAFVYVPTGFDNSAASFMLAAQNGGQYQGITLNLYNGSFQTVNTVNNGNVVKTSTTAMAKAQWVCVEWEVQTGAAGSTALTLDGAAANGLGGAQALNPNGGLGQFSLALVGNAGTPARDLWIDELAIDNTPIGCTL